MAASQDEINWVLTSYIVAAAIMTAPTGFLAARFGRTRLFVTAVVGFTIASILCGMAQSLDQIVVFRVLQGMFGAALVPLSQSVMFDIYPAEQRGAAMARLDHGRHDRADLRPDPGRLAHRKLQLALGLLHQRSVRHSNSGGLLTFLKETSYGKSARLDWIGFGALGLRDRRVPDHARPWRNIGLVRLARDHRRSLPRRHRLVRLPRAIFPGATGHSSRRSCLPIAISSSGSCFTSSMGLIMYATLALLAPYLQKLMDYPVVTAGIVLAPRGAGHDGGRA